MKNELLSLKRNALKLGLCGRYKDLWDACKTEKDLMDLVLDSNGIEFLADAMAFGWGVSFEYLEESVFRNYVHGQYLRNKDGYTSTMYVNPKCEFVLTATINLVVGGCSVIHNQSGNICKLYICKTSNVTIKNDGVLELYCYGDVNVEVINGKDAICNRHDIKCSKWLKSS